MEFWKRRAIRLFPALITVLAVLSIAGWLVLTASELKALGKHLLSGALYFSNITLFLESGYFDSDSRTKPLLHLWSLAVEEQFYLAWPIILAGLSLLTRRLVVWSVIFLIASFAAAVYFSSSGGSFAYYMPFTRAWQLMVGATAAALLRRNDNALSLLGQTPAGSSCRTWASC